MKVFLVIYLVVKAGTGTGASVEVEEMPNMSTCKAIKAQVEAGFPNRSSMGVKVKNTVLCVEG